MPSPRATRPATRPASNSAPRTRLLFDQDDPHPRGGRPGDDSTPELASASERDLLEQVRQRLGLPEPLVPHTERIPVAHLIIEHPDDRLLQAGARRLAHNMLLNGLLHPPAVVPVSPEDPRAPGRFAVWFGQRRTLAAQLLHAEGVPGWEVIRCDVYPLPDPALARRIRAALTLSENLCRSEQRWVEDLRNLVTFLDHPAPLRDAEIWQALGIDPQRFKALVTLARLPRPILDQAFAGQIASEGLLRMIARRLSAAQRRVLAERATAGEIITSARVDALWRGALDDAVAAPALQAALAQDWLDRQDGQDEQDKQDGATTGPRTAPTAAIVTATVDDPVPFDLAAVPDIPRLAILGPESGMSAPLAPVVAPPHPAGCAREASPMTAEEDGARAEIIRLWESVQRALPLLLRTAGLRQARLYAQALAQELEPWRRHA